MSRGDSVYTSYITAQVRSLEKQSPTDQRSGNPFVTVSRQAGAFGIKISKDLCSYLQKKERRANRIWAVFDKELLAEVAQEHDLPETVLPYLSEAAVSGIQDMIEEGLGLHPSHNLLVLKLNKTILHLAQLGYAIIVGRAASIITARMPCGIHIRLVCPLEKRLVNAQESYGMKPKEAREFIIKEDSERRDYVRRYFDKDIEDPLLYDMVINVDGLVRQEIVHAIGDLVFNRYP